MLLQDMVMDWIGLAWDGYKMIGLLMAGVNVPVP